MLWKSYRKFWEKKIMSDSQWKKLEEEMLQFELKKPTSRLKQKCLSMPPAPPRTFFSWHVLAVAAVLIIIASWSSYENFVQHKNFSHRSTSISYSLQHRLDTESLSQHKKFGTVFVTNKNVYTVGENRAKWLQ